MKRFPLIFLNTVILLLLVEGAARVAEWVHPPAEEVSFDYAPYRMLRMSHAPWQLNSDGFRAAELDSYRGKFIVEFVGGSVCLGVGTHPGDTVPQRLEQALHEAGMTEAAVVNLCQGGAPTAQELAIFVQYGLPLQPQVVFSFNGANDFMHPVPLGEDPAANLPYLDAAMRATFGGRHNPLAHLALTRVAARLAQRLPPPPPPETEAVDPQQIFDSYLYVNEIVKTLTEAQGGHYALMLQPTVHHAKPWSQEEMANWQRLRPYDGEEASRYADQLYGDARAAIDAWAGKTGATYYDLTQVFAHTGETVYTDSVHFTGETGYRMLTEELDRQNWLAPIEQRYREWEQETEAGSSAAPETGGRVEDQLAWRR